MTVVLISGGLTFVVGLVLLRPFLVTDRGLQVPTQTADDFHRRQLLRQLRDLDDDLGAGRLTQDDHARLRDPVEREAAIMHRHTRGRAGNVAVASSARYGSITLGPSQGPDAGGGARPWRRRTATLLALGAAAASVTILLVSAVSSRHPGQTITGNSVAGLTPAVGSPSGNAQPSQSGHRSPTSSELAAVAEAEALVRQNPKDLSAHLTLAEAYAAAGSSQLAAVEYLAVTRLDPTNAEANTNLALLAFDAGRPTVGKAMVDRVLAADPNYPEALYVRGLINMIGLRRPRAAAHDFSAYLAAAPFGSYRTAAATLLVLARSREH